MKKLMIVLAVMAVFGLATAQASVTTSLSHHWKLDETSGSTAFDSVGGGFDGTTTGATINQTGQIGKAYYFDGSGDYVTVGTSMLPDTADFTYSAWINGPAASSGTLFGQRNGTSGGCFDIVSSKLRIIVGGSPYDTGNVTVLDNDWHYVAVTRGSGDNTWKIWVDGKLDTSNPNDTKDMNAGGAAYRMGLRGSAGTVPLTATLDDVGTWTRALTATEIAAVAGLGKFSGIALDNSKIDDVLAMSSIGQSVSGVGSETWWYVTGLTGTQGTTGGSVGGGDAYIVLGTDGTGVTLTSQAPPIAEPAGLGLLGVGLLALRKRRS